MNERQLFGLEDLVQRWGVSLNTVRRAILRGDIKTINIGARRLVPLEEITRIEGIGLGKGRKRMDQPAVEAR